MSYNNTREKNPLLQYYMPLSNGASPLDGPTKSVFSVPSFNYSRDTQALVKNFMSESKLTHAQQSGFQSILRNGKALPTRPSDVYRQELFKHRHALKAMSHGIPIMNNVPRDYQQQLSTSQQLRMKFGPGGRRTYNTIRNSGELDLIVNTSKSRRYIPFDKEKEKERLAHRMAFGKDPPPKNEKEIRPKIRGLTPEKEQTPKLSLLDERFLELLHEIQERVDFLLQMRALGNEKAYRGPIVLQIQELVAQMKTISPDKTQEYVKILKLGRIDKCFDEDGYKFDNLLTRE